MEKKNQKNLNKKKITYFFFQDLSLFIYFCHQICAQGPYNFKSILKNTSPDSVQSGKFGLPGLSGQETHMPCPVEP